MEWSYLKPDQPCVFVSAKFIGNHWEHDAWEIKWVHDGEQDYLCLFTGDGSEWGDLEDLKADKYLILPKHQ